MSFNNLIALQNMGNTCYLNSAIQLFLSSDSIIDTFKSIPKKHMFLNLIDELIRKRKRYDILIANPILIKNELAQYNSFFNQHGQQDCHECLINLLHTIHEYSKEDINLTPYIGYILKDNESLEIKSQEKLRKDFNMDGYSKINSLVLGQLKSSLVCQECNKERINFENIIDISLSLPNSREVDIIDCFINYFKKEELDTTIECEYCKKNTKTIKNLCVWRFPKNLIIHLKRYTQHNNGNYSRNNCIVDFSSELVFQDNQNNNRKIEYQLKSVVNHIGFSPLSGHYSTYIKYNHPKTNNELWVHIDDSNIYKINESKIISTSAYILLYEMV